jgi:predicted AAA+ superfamily ATPase
MRDDLEKIRVWEVEMSLRKTSKTRTMEEILTELSKRRRLIVILDEVQEIKGGINHFLSMLARLRNSTRNLSFLFTGSSIGLMDTLLHPEEVRCTGGARLR